MIVEREDLLDEAIAAFLEARETGSPFDRAAWLATYPDLQPELEKYLTDYDRFDRLIAPLRSAAGDTPMPGGLIAAPFGEPLTPGRIIGDFELQEELGRGGMGVVFKAHQVSLRRVVALKMIRAGSLATPGDVRRFQRETEIVARLDHPNIVPVFETGVADGLHFFSMRLVEGGTLAGRRAEFRADPRRSARLVATVARAVDFAHRHAVLHRDLKPANILLDGDVPFVTDFGLAKPVDGEALTTTGGALGTPAYMAPEQATGAAVTTAADVYSLGAILYELLAGRPPFRGETPLGTLMDAMNREPTRPRALAPRLDQDLETVCLKCLEKDPSRRYDSAAALADDLERWLRHEPVRARPVGLLGRSARWARRHPLPAGLSFALAVAVLAGFVLVFWQWRRAENNLTLARAHQRRAEEGLHDAREMLDEFCNRLSDDRLSKLPGAGPLRQELLESGLRYYQRFLEQARDDPKARQDVADAHFRLGVIRAALGAKTAARDHYRQALEHYDALLQGDPAADRPRRMATKTLINYGSLLWDAAQNDDALAAFRRADDLVQQSLNEHPNIIDLLTDRAAALTNLGLLLQERGDAAAGRKALADAHAIKRQLADGQSPDTAAKANLGRSHLNLANDLSAQGKHAEALEQLRQAQTHLEQTAKAAAWDAGVQRSLAEVHRALGGTLWSLGRHSAAEAEYRQGQAMLESLVRAYPDSALYRSSLAILLTNFGNVHAARKRPADARAAYEEAVALHERLLADDPGSRKLLIAQGQTLHNLGNLHRNQKSLNDALMTYKTACDLFQQRLAVDPRDYAVSYFLAGSFNNMADVLQQLDRPAEGEETFAEAVRRARDALAGAPQNRRYRDQLIASLGNLARAQQRAGKTDAAAESTRERDRLRRENETAPTKTTGTEK